MGGCSHHYVRRAAYLSPRLSRVDVPKVRGFGEVQAQGGFVLELGATGGGSESSSGGKA